MNRSQRRQFVKRARKEGFSRGAAEAYLAVKEMGDVADKAPKMFKDGEKVRINIEKIKKRKDYEDKSEKYKKVIEEEGEKVFEVKNLRGNLYSLDGLDGWLFWGGDLERVSDATV